MRVTPIDERRQPGGSEMDRHTTIARLGAAINPLLGRDIADFTAAVTRFAATRAVPSTVAVVGLTPGEGRTSVAALLALAAAGWSDRRIAVLDTVAAGVGPQPMVGGVATVGDVAGRTVTALLGGDVRRGRLPSLFEPSAGNQVVARSRLRMARTPGAAVPVLSMPPGGPGFSPQFVEQSLAQLRQRADLVVIDTPAGPASPVLHGVLQHADHVLLVVRGDGDVDRRLQATLRWLEGAPGRAKRRSVTGVIVSRGWTTPSWRSTDLPVVVLPRDEGLRRRRTDRLGRQAMIAGLTVAAEVGEAADRSLPFGAGGSVGNGHPVAAGHPVGTGQSGAEAGVSGSPDPSIFGHR